MEVVTTKPIFTFLAQLKTQHFCYWAAQNYRELHQRLHHSPKIDRTLLGRCGDLVFIEEGVNSNQYYCDILRGHFKA